MAYPYIDIPEHMWQRTVSRPFELEHYCMQFAMSEFGGNLREGKARFEVREAIELAEAYPDLFQQYFNAIL